MRLIIAIIKHFTQMDLFKFVTSLKKVNFVESYENKQAKKDDHAGHDHDHGDEKKSK